MINLFNLLGKLGKHGLHKTNVVDFKTSPQSIHLHTCTRHHQITLQLLLQCPKISDIPRLKHA